MVYEICAIATVVILALLVIWVIRTLNAAKRFLEVANHTLHDMGAQMNVVVKETNELLRSTHEITQDIEKKIHSLDSIFASVSEVQDSLQEATGSVKHILHSAVHTAENIEKVAFDKQSVIIKAAQWIKLGINFWNSWQTHRNEKLMIKGVD
jgi:uncharacterized protein YoxC